MIRDHDDPQLVLSRIMPAATGVEVAEHFAKQAISQLLALGVQYSETQDDGTTDNVSPQNPEEIIEGDAVERLTVLYMTFMSVRGLMSSEPSAWAIERAD